MSNHQHTVLLLFIIVLFLRVYASGKIQSVWATLNGITASKTTTTQPTAAKPQVQGTQH